MKFKKFCPETIHISGCINVHICIFAIAIVLHVNIHDYCNHLYFFFFFFLIFFLSLSPLLLCDPKPLPNSTQNQPNKPKSKPNQTQRKTYEKPNKKKTINLLSNLSLLSLDLPLLLLPISPCLCLWVFGFGIWERDE